MDTTETSGSLINSEPTSKKPTKSFSSKMRIFKTSMLVIPFVVMGMSHSIQFSTLPDMRIRLNTNAQQLSYAMSAGTAGGFFGGLVASVADRYADYTELLIAITLYVVGGSFSMFAYSPTIWVLGVLDFMFSFGWALYQAAAHSVISYLWGVNGGPARYAIHFGYPVGSILGPLLAMPFVSGKTRPLAELNGENGTSSELQFLSYNATSDAFLEKSPDYGIQTTDTSTIEYAYVIVSVIVAINATVYIFMQFLTTHPEKDQQLRIGVKTMQSFRQVLSPSEWADGDGRFGLTMLILVTLFYILQIAAMKGSQEYLVTYAVDTGLFTNKEAAVLNSVVYGAGTLARGLAIICSKYIAIPYILFIDVHGQLLFGLLCLLFGRKSDLSLWILAPGLGFFRELMWPTGYAWLDYYIILLGVIVGLIDAVVQSFNIGFVALQGYLYDNASIDSIFYTTVAYGSAMCLLTYAMSFYAAKKGSRKLRTLKKIQEKLSISCESTKL